MPMLQSTYSDSLVLLSLVVATLASYTALDLSGRIATLGEKQYRTAWLFGGACAMGTGIWSMHFVGMLAFSLPIALGYDLSITAASLVIAIVVSYFALSLVTRGALSVRRLIGGGILMGIGIAGMHYTGMAAMRMFPNIQYDPAIFLLSVAIAIAASIAALWIAFTLRTASRRYRTARRMGAALVMGLAITGMHYTGMAAANFPVGSICRAASDTSAGWLAITIAGGTISVLAITLVLSILDARLESRTTRFAKSLQSANDRLLHLATHDALTELPNRLLLSERIQHAIDASERAGEHFAVFFIDLDGFKSINDSLGHSIGDTVLTEIAGRLKQVVRKEDTVARFGGDEFVVVVESIHDATMATYIAEKLFTCFQHDLVLDGTSMTITPSIGISIYPQDGSTIETLLQHADAAMYEAKASGRNGYRFFEPGINAVSVRNMELQRALRGAIEKGELFVQYQPKFDCRSAKLLGAEALVRWQHPELGLIPPAEFIPVAEHAGQILHVGQWVITEVCAHLQQWRDAGLPTLKVAINLSPVQLRAPNLVENVLAITSRYGVAPSSLMFEITESVAMYNAEETMKTFHKLQDAGFDMAIDDFGTGYSCLSYLQQFAVRQLKVDRCFVSALDGADEKGVSIVSAIIGLAHSLNMEVVAEGVETSRQLAKLNAMHCDQVQGFLLGYPLDAQDFVQLVEQSHQGDRSAA